jgi:hypothetical protein
VSLLDDHTESISRSNGILSSIWSEDVKMGRHYPR